MPTPIFISLDGIDGTGKSTQCQRLAAWLTSLHIPVVTCHDPGSTPLGTKLRQILLDMRTETMSMRAEALLFMASRADLVEQVIRPALSRGEIVLSDRYLLANVVYQGHAGGLPVTDLWDVGRFATAGIAPDLTLVLDMPVDQARARRQRSADRIESRGLDHQERIRQGFLHEAQRFPDRMRVVDACPSADQVQQHLQSLVTTCLQHHGWDMSHPGPVA